MHPLQVIRCWAPVNLDWALSSLALNPFVNIKIFCIKSGCKGPLCFVRLKENSMYIEFRPHENMTYRKLSFVCHWTYFQITIFQNKLGNLEYKKNLNQILWVTHRLSLVQEQNQLRELLLLGTQEHHAIWYREVF